MRLFSIVIKITYTFWKGDPICFALVSRRSCMRTGMRYRTRGINHFGYAANFVETEQLVIFNNTISSFVQTRGSIPLLWEQRQHNLDFKFVFSGSKKMVTNELFFPWKQTNIIPSLFL